MNQESKTGDRKGPAQTGQQAPKPGTVFQDPDQHELALTMPAAAPPTTPKGPLAGFDTCAARSLPTVKAWRARYAATSVYIGGQMMGCGQNNLSAGWVQQAKASPARSTPGRRPRREPRRPARRSPAPGRTASARARPSTTTWRATTGPTPAADLDGTPYVSSDMVASVVVHG